MSTKKRESDSDSVIELARNNSAPPMFVTIRAICVPLPGLSPAYLLSEIMTRLGRNMFLVLSLLIPIMVGMGLNFGTTSGAMAGWIGFIFVADWQVWSISGMILAVIISIPTSILLDVFCGKVLNMAKGREMIVNCIITSFMGGIYQLVVPHMMGSATPIKYSNIRLSCGYDIRSTISPLNMRQSLDDLVAVRTGGVKIPVLTLLVIVLLCLFTIWFRKTRLGQDICAVGQDMGVTSNANIKVERTRIIAIVMSTVCVSIGMAIYLQDMGNIPTYSSHKQIGMFCIATLLVGGASIDRMNIDNVFLGAILFHLMFIVIPPVEAKTTGDSMVGEYLHMFISYGVITLALIMYETKRRRAKNRTGEQLKFDQDEEDVN